MKVTVGKTLIVVDIEVVEAEEEVVEDQAMELMVTTALDNKDKDKDAPETIEETTRVEEDLIKADTLETVTLTTTGQILDTILRSVARPMETTNIQVVKDPSSQIGTLDEAVQLLLVKIKAAVPAELSLQNKITNFESVKRFHH